MQKRRSSPKWNGRDVSSVLHETKLTDNPDVKRFLITETTCFERGDTITEFVEKKRSSGTLTLLSCWYEGKIWSIAKKLENAEEEENEGNGSSFVLDGDCVLCFDEPERPLRKIVDNLGSWRREEEEEDENDTFKKAFESSDDEERTTFVLNVLSKHVRPSTVSSLNRKRLYELWERLELVSKSLRFAATDSSSPPLSNERRPPH